MTTELLTEDTVAGYLASHPDFAGTLDVTRLEVREVGDGNLNLVFIARDGGGRSLAIKQTLPYVRSDHSWAVTEDSIFAEARGLEAARLHAPGLAPAYHGLDAERRLVVIEDLSQWRVWRGALNDGLIAPGAGAAVGSYVAGVGFGTSYFAQQPEAVQVAAASAVNPELERITEDLVFTEPYFEHEHNSWEDGATDVVIGLRDDSLRTRVAALKLAFLTRAESLIHGDLHTGSVFVPPSDLLESPGTPAAKAFDFEFGFYGPTAFDLGMFLGNVVIAQSRDAVIGNDPAFTSWLGDLYRETWAAFDAGIRERWPHRVDPLFTDEFLERWLAETWTLAVGYAGVEAIRRTIGWAKVSDLTTLAGEDRAAAECHVLTAARALIENAPDIDGPDALPDVVRGSRG